MNIRQSDTVIEQLGQRLPPQNLEAEQSLLGAMLLSPDAIAEATEKINPEAFYRAAHKSIYQAIINLYAEGEPADAITVAEQLMSMNKLEDVGGKPYLHTLISSVPTPGNAKYYAEIVERNSVLRSLITAANDIAAIAFSSPEELKDAIDEAESIMFNVSKNSVSERFTDIASLAKEVMKEAEQIQASDKHIAGLSSGFSKLDSITGGFHASDLIIVAGRPGMGKTSFALNLAFNIGLKNTPVAIFSLEMSKEQLAQRMLCSEARVNSWKLRNGKLNDNEWHDLASAVSKLSNAPIYIDDTANLNPMELRTKARRMAARNNLGLIIVDYMQLMHGYKKSDSREQEVSQISRALKTLAREVNVPIIAVSQLSRAVEKREHKRPMLSDLRESGAIEQDADMVIFIYRDKDDEDESSDSNPQVEISIAKHRNGPTGEICLQFQKDFVRFVEPTAYQAPSEAF